MRYKYQIEDAPSADCIHGRQAILDFVRNRLDFHPDAVQTQVLLSAHKSGILNCTRQWGKSSVAAAMAVYEAVTNPGNLIIVLSSTHRQSMEMVKKAKNFASRLGEPVKGDGIHKCSVGFENGSRIIALPSKEDTTRGYSAVNLLIVDEASRVADDVYYAMRPALAVSKGRVWLLSTPFGKRGFFWREWDGGGDAWVRFSVAAEDCPRISAETLALEKSVMAADMFEQEFCCKFTESIGAIFEQELLDQAEVDDAEDWLL